MSEIIKDTKPGMTRNRRKSDENASLSRQGFDNHANGSTIFFRGLQVGFRPFGAPQKSGAGCRCGTLPLRSGLS